jgi:hypothetical protein
VPGWARRPDLRISTEDRTAVAEQLAEHFAAGRLDEVEFNDRLERAMAAKTGAELAPLLADLPGSDPEPPPPASRAGRVRQLARLVVIAVVVLFAVGALGHLLLPGPHLLVVLLVVFAVWRLTGHRHRWPHGSPPA